MLLALVVGCGASGPSAGEVCVVRHGQAYKNLSPTPDVPVEKLDSLTELGLGQADAAAARVAGAKLLWTSPAGRTRETAARLGLGEAVVRAELRPIDGPAWDARVGAWKAGNDPRPEGGESLADAQARVDALLAELRPQVPPGARAVLVTHGDIASLILGALRGVPLLERPTTIQLANAEVACAPL